MGRRVRKPNFLIIVTDDQGYADLSAFKHHAQDVHTPNMDRLVARGALFTEAYVSAPVCSPSRAGWTTGQHQVRWDPKSSFACGLPKDVPHIAEIMKANGYTTARFGKNDYGKGLHRHNVREYPLNHGYDASESRNLIESHPDVAQRLKKIYAEWSKEVAGGKQRANQ